MKVFITGGSGLIGSGVVKQLVAGGHTVTALARSDASASKLTALGANPVLGTHTDLELLKQSAAAADAVVHCAFNHDIFAQPGGTAIACEQDRDAITAMCDALAESGSGKAFINSSGVLGNLTSDEFSEKMSGPLAVRALSEKLVVSYKDRGVKGVNIRLAPVVHSHTPEHMFISGQIAAAKKSGYVGYVGEGANLWPACHASDASTLYVLAITSEKVQAGATLNGVAEEGISTKEIAEFIAKKLGMETKSVKPEDAQDHWGFLAHILQLGGKITTQYTREWTGWNPTGPTLFEDMNAGYKF